MSGFSALKPEKPDERRVQRTSISRVHQVGLAARGNNRLLSCGFMSCCGTQDLLLLRNMQIGWRRAGGR